MATASHIRRINVWETRAIAAEVAAADAVEWFGKMTIYPSESIALANVETDEGGGAFVLDMVPGALGAYGHRAMSAAMLGQPVYRLQRETGGAEMDVIADAVTGEIDTAAIAAWITGGDFARPLTWYDQSGAGNHLTDSGDGIMPVRWALASNGKAAFVRAAGPGVVTTFSPGSTYAVNLPSGNATIFMVCQGQVTANYRSVSGAAYMQMRSGAAAFIDSSNDSGGATGAGGVYTSLISNTGWVMLDASVTFGENDYRLNGTRLTENNSNDIGAVAALNSLQARMSIGASGGQGLQEFLIYDGIMGSTNRTALRANMATWAGITIA